MLYRLVRYAEVSRSRFALLACHGKSVRDPATHFLVVRSNRPIRFTKSALAQLHAASPHNGGFPCRHDDPAAQFAIEADASRRFESACLSRLTATWNDGMGR